MANYAHPETLVSTDWVGKGGKSDGSLTVGDVWRPSDRNKVHYYKYKEPTN